MTALALIQEAGAPLIRRAAQRWSPKVIERDAGIPAKTAEKHRSGATEPSWPAFVAWCRQDPELRAWMLEQLSVNEDPQAMLATLSNMLARKG